METQTCCRPVPRALRERLLRLSERAGDARLLRLAEGQLPENAAPERASDFEDWVDTCVMDAFRTTRDEDAFSLLYERNADAFVRAIRCRLRRARPGIAEMDVLQEAFFAIYRYPHKFAAARADAFRNWAFSIVRNTTIRSIQRDVTRGMLPVEDEMSAEIVDVRERDPERAASEHERAEDVDRAYVLALAIYLNGFEQLTPRAKRILTDVEIEHRPYRQIAADLGCPVGNVKMAVFRARRAIHRRMARSLQELRVA